MFRLPIFAVSPLEVLAILVVAAVCVGVYVYRSRPQ